MPPVFRLFARFLKAASPVFSRRYNRFGIHLVLTAFASLASPAEAQEVMPEDDTTIDLDVITVTAT
jgi:hypothetical protein